MKTITVNDSVQKNYQYKLVEPTGKNFHPEFKPELTPKQMWDLGIFGGVYFDKDQREFPKSWFKSKNISKTGEPEAKINFFETLASQSLEEWQKKGWIYKEDPRGWYQWYCRYYLGRRIPQEDERQIKRWKAMRRHAGQIKKYCKPYDMNCHRRQRQALLHWSYDSRKM